MPLEYISEGCFGSLLEFFIYDLIAFPGRLVRFLCFKLTFQKIEWGKLSGRQEGKTGSWQALWNVLIGLFVYLVVILFFAT